VPVRWTQLAATLARKAQEELERAVLHIAEAFRRRFGRLAVLGGVALNCTPTVDCSRRLEGCLHPSRCNGRWYAVGLALYGWIEVLSGAATACACFQSIHGRRYSRRDVRRCQVFRLDAFVVETPGEGSATRAARGEVVCWFEGESEWDRGRSVVAASSQVRRARA
jgi:predicted NodU family carbamoyl transferase